MQQTSHLLLRSFNSAFGILQLLIRTSGFFPLLSPWTMMTLQTTCSWSSLSYSVTLSVAVGTTSSLLSTSTASWMKAGSKIFKTFAKKMLSLFGSTYLCKKTFSVMNITKSHVRMRLSDSHLRDVLRIKTTVFEPELDYILQSRSQYHPSH